LDCHFLFICWLLFRMKLGHLSIVRVDSEGEVLSDQGFLYVLLSLEGILCYHSLLHLLNCWSWAQHL
jgi:hypothetical protein